MTPEERAERILSRLTIDREKDIAEIATAIREEREACASIARTWGSSHAPEGLGEAPEFTGCWTCYGEGVICEAPEEIAAAIRART